MRPPLHPRYWFVPFEAAEKTDVAIVRGEISVVDGLHDRPVNDVTTNIHLRDVVGSKTDTSFSGGNHNPSIIGHLKASYYHVHGNSFTIPDNAPVSVAPGNGAYVYGAPVQIGSYALTTYDVHWIQVSDMDDNGYYNIQLCNIDGTIVYGKTSMFRDNNFVQEGNVPIQISPAAKGTVMYARLGVSTGNIAHTISVKLFCHPYGDLT